MIGVDIESDEIGFIIGKEKTGFGYKVAYNRFLCGWFEMADI